MPINFWRWLGVMATPLLLNTCYAGGLLNLSQVELTISPQQRLPELVVENRGNGTLYLEIKQQLLKNPGSQPETLVDVGNTEAPSLLVMPSRLKLGPGQKRSMQLSILSQPAKSQVWRITFRPQQDLNVTTNGVALPRAPLLISIGYGVVIYQLGHQP